MHETYMNGGMNNFFNILCNTIFSRKYSSYTKKTLSCNFYWGLL